MNSTPKTFRYLTLIALVLPLPLYAAGPVAERFDFAYESEPMAGCGDFVILADGAGTTHLTTFYDRQGAPSRITMHGNYSGLMTNSISGKTLVDAPSVANITIDVQAGTQTNVGTYWSVTVPGVGVILLEAGRLVFDGEGPPVFVAGPHLPPPETIASLCRALR